MGIEFHVARGDHLKVEDFLARDHDGVVAIILDAKSASYQENLADLALAEGVDVLLDPRTDRLEHPGLRLEQLPGYRPDGYDLGVLAARLDMKQRLTESVLAAQDGLVSIVTPAYFFGEDERSMNLNLDLAEVAKASTDLPVRPIVALRSRTPRQRIVELAEEYARAGFNQVDLRFSPLGGEGDSIAKVRMAFEAANAFRRNGIRVTLGHSGNLGQVAFALGHVSAFSVGIGIGERVNLAGEYARQNKPPRVDSEGKVRGGQFAGVYLAGLAATLAKGRAAALLEHSDIRTRIGRCRIGACTNSVTGPTSDYRLHYLHAKAAEVAFLQNTPDAWRAEAEVKRLRRALELRTIVNRDYMKRGESLLKTRTLESLIDEIGELRKEAVA